MATPQPLFEKVWLSPVMLDAGIRCVVASSFGDIFAGTMPVGGQIALLPGRIQVDLPESG